MRKLPLLLVLAGSALLLGVILAVVLTSEGKQAAPPPPATTTAPPPTSVPQTTAPPPPPPPPPPSRAMSWRSAGAFVWHETDIDPAVLGREMRANGFGWVAIRVHDGLAADPVDSSWIDRFRAAGGLPVGGWGVLRDHPQQEAQLASSLIGRYGLDFYIADGEAEYGYSGQGGPSRVRFARSGQFVAAFRALRPDLPAGLSSYCRPDQHDLDWAAWRGAGFVFLPQAYVGQLGPAAAPEACIQGAARFFPKEDVHPTLATFRGAHASPSPAAYSRMLAQAGTVGFSLYLAEVGMTTQSWQAYGRAIARLQIAG